MGQAIADRVRWLLRAAAGPALEVLDGVGVQLPSGVLIPDVTATATTDEAVTLDWPLAVRLAPAEWRPPR